MFEKAMAQGLSVAEATQAVLDASPWLDDEEDEAYTYLALARLQLDLGALEPLLREKILAILATNVPMWRYETSDAALIAERAEVLRDLARELSADEH